jgi:hypothetical protein
LGVTVHDDDSLLNGLYFNSILLVSIGKTNSIHKTRTFLSRSSEFM